MLILTDQISDICYDQLMAVYEESNCAKGEKLCPRRCGSEQRMIAEQDLYHYLMDVFDSKQARIAIWAPQGRYRTALRLELYDDGYLLSGVETAPNDRRRGYAKALLEAVINAADKSVLYSHIAKCNTPSIRLHERCGFVCIKDYAAYLDGSVSTDAYTYARYVE